MRDARDDWRRFDAGAIPTKESTPRLDLVGRAGALLSRVGGRTDVEIIECHHRHKEDSPSGIALKFRSLVQQAMGQTRSAHGREGRPGARPGDEIGYHAVRTGDNPGEHTILFGMEGESFSVNVRATNRDCYARGALAAAAFLVGKPAGLYSMRDVLASSDPPAPVAQVGNLYYRSRGSVPRISVDGCGSRRGRHTAFRRSPR